jgi:hypothetical protein
MQLQTDKQTYRVMVLPQLEMITEIPLAQEAFQGTLAHLLHVHEAEVMEHKVRHPFCLIV